MDGVDEVVTGAVTTITLETPRLYGVIDTRDSDIVRVAVDGDSIIVNHYGDDRMDATEVM